MKRWLVATGMSMVLAAGTCSLAGDTEGKQTDSAEPTKTGLRILDMSAKETLTVAKLNRGDKLRFQLRNGDLRTFVIEETRARIVERGGRSGIVVYWFEARLLADGQPMTLGRFVGSQESFYEPWVVNGVRIWFSSSQASFDLVPIRYPDNHHPLDYDAILALQDATLSICPQPMRPWFPVERLFIDVGECYGGQDPWMGAYQGRAAHMGLDVDMPKGTPLYAPLDFDDQWIFSGGHRWRGVRLWENGDAWALQSHHLDRLLIEQKTSLKAGTHYANAAGRAVGAYPHSHFEFHVGRKELHSGRPAGLDLDPWILFWQMFETEKDNRGEIRADIAPVSPTTTGRPVRFSAEGSRSGKGSGPLRYTWTFGDGGWSNEPAALHTFFRPGVYPVTLVVDDGRRLAARTQHVTVNGDLLSATGFALDAPDEVSFRPRPVAAADVYGWPVKHIPRSLRFAMPPGGSLSSPRRIFLRPVGQGTLPPAEPPEVAYLGAAEGWLRATLQGMGNKQRIEVAVDPRNLPLGLHEAVVIVRCPGTVNPVQGFRVQLNVRPTPEAAETIVDDRDDEFYATPYFWVGHQRQSWGAKGYRGRYLTNGGIADDNAIVRYTPDLAAGRYEALFHPDTPFRLADAESSFWVRVRHASGEEKIRFAPRQAKTRSLGSFDFAEGNEGFVEIAAKGSKGLIIADALIFRRTGPEGAEN